MSNIEERYIRRNGAINTAFGLTYASFLVVPRTFLMDMPTEWQDKFTKLMEEYNEKVENIEPENEFSMNVTFKKDGKFCKTPEVFTSYRHPEHEDIL
jgi:hypothetical protein